MRLIKKAIALEYGKNRAPIVTAKGEEEAALEMIAQALSVAAEVLSRLRLAMVVSVG